MTPKQYRASIKRLGLYQEETGVLLGSSKRTGQIWAEVGIKGPAEILLKLLLVGKIGVEDIRAVKRG